MGLNLLGMLSGGYLYVGIALAAFGVGGYAMHVWDAGTIADLKVEVAADKQAISDYEAAVAKDVAAANEKARSQEHDLAQQAATLREQLGTDEALLATRSTEDQKGLNDATTADTSPLGRAMLAYVERVRREQSATVPHP